MFEYDPLKKVKKYFSCIVCGESSDNLLCDSCKEALLAYRNTYFTGKKLKETTELDEEVFKLTYETAINQLKDDPITDETDLSILIEAFKSMIRDEPSMAWYREREGRADRFLEYARKRARKEFLHAD